jgi:hypothetical protein
LWTGLGPQRAILPLLHETRYGETCTVSVLSGRASRRGSSITGPSARGTRKARAGARALPASQQPTRSKGSAPRTTPAGWTARSTRSSRRRRRTERTWVWVGMRRLRANGEAGSSQAASPSPPRRPVREAAGPSWMRPRRPRSRTASSARKGWPRHLNARVAHDGRRREVCMMCCAHGTSFAQCHIRQAACGAFVDRSLRRRAIDDALRCVATTAIRERDHDRQTDEAPRITRTFPHTDSLSMGPRNRCPWLVPRGSCSAVRRKSTGASLA